MFMTQPQTALQPSMAAVASFSSSHPAPPLQDPPSASPPSTRRSCGARLKHAIKLEAQEAKEAAQEAYQFARTHDWKTTLRRVSQRKYWHWWFLLTLVVTASVVLSSHHQEIARAIQPYREQIRSRGWTWILPTLLLIVVSFPPLFGHEIIILAVGMIWGVLRGFGIACLGTFLGELVTYYAFKHWFRSRANKIEQKHVTYACLARLMREGGLPMVTLVRFSAVPGHLTTAVQSTIGLSIWIFSAACILSLPKQFALVYLGLLMADTEPAPSANPDPAAPPGSDKSPVDKTSSRHRVVSLIVFTITAFASLTAAYIIWMRMRKIRKIILSEMKAKQQQSAAEATETTLLDDISRAELGGMKTYHRTTSHLIERREEGGGVDGTQTGGGAGNAVQSLEKHDMVPVNLHDDDDDSLWLKMHKPYHQHGVYGGDLIPESDSASTLPSYDRARSSTLSLKQPDDAQSIHTISGTRAGAGTGSK